MDKVKNYIIVGGKTGGHLFPGVAIAQELSAQGGKVYFLCTHRQLDRNVLTQYCFSFYPIFSESPRGFFILFLLKLFIGFIQSCFYILKIKPDVVVGLGGFPSVPGVLAAKILGKRVVLLEQNVHPGKANIFLARFATKICLAFEKTKKYLDKYKEKLVHTGNPIRREIVELENISKQDLKQALDIKTDKSIILITGGSQGAKCINDTLKQYIILNFKNFYFIHITGVKDFEATKDFYDKNNVLINVIPFSKDIGRFFACSDLVISRAGGTTVAELGFLKKRCILIPFGAATESHQNANAQALVEAGLACVIDEGSLNVQKISEQIEIMLKKELPEKINWPFANEVMVRIIR